MTPERILQYAPLVLDQQSREQYFADGFLTVPGYVGGAWLRRLREVVAAKIEESRALSASDDQFDLAPDHTVDKPNIRRLRKAVDRHAPTRTHDPDGVARPWPGADPRAHGAVPGEAAAAMGSRGLSIDLRSAGRGGEDSVRRVAYVLDTSGLYSSAHLAALM